MIRLLLPILLLLPLISQGQGRSKALVIGISKYSQLSKESQLQYADDDALDFYNFLLSKSAGDFDSASIRLLLNEKATAAEIYGALDWLIDEARENDRIIIYFSGHGDIETKTVRQRGFLLAHDSPRAGYKVGGTIDITTLQDYLETLVSENKARVLLVTDACRSGKLAGGAAGATHTTAALQENWAKITKVLSSQAGELSGESKEWGNGHGIFTYTLLNGLWGMADSNKDGLVSLSELNIYLSQEVPKATGESQHPVISGDLKATMSKADATMVAAISAKTTGQDLKMLIASAKGSTGLMDTTTLRLYGQFNNAILKNDLILPTGSNAFFYYKELVEKNKKNAVLNNDVRRSLVARLEDAAQKVLNKYISQEAVTEGDYTLARQELDTALALISKDHSRYKAMLSRKLFLESNILGCTCNKDDVAPEVAAASLKLLRQAVALEPDASYLYNSMGNAHFYGKKYDSAILNYNKSIQLAPTWAYPVNNLGTAFRAKKQYDKAFEKYSAAAKLTPLDPHASNLAGNTYMQLKKYDLAIVEYKKVLLLDSAEYIHNNLGTAYFFKKDYEKSVYYFDKAVAQDFAYAYDYGILYYGIKKFDLSKKYYGDFLRNLDYDHFENSYKYDAQYPVDSNGNFVNGQDPLNPASYDLPYVYKTLGEMAERDKNLPLSYVYKGCMYFWKSNSEPTKAHEWFEKSVKTGLKFKPGQAAPVDLKVMEWISSLVKQYDNLSWEEVVARISDK
jgi:tetratricopeptide (TPR) repeat protein